MKVFHCDHCGQVLFFENSTCVTCGRRVAYLHFHCNLEPREIVRLCPDEFKNEDEVYRLKRNIMERVLRNADKIRWRLSDGDR